MFQLTVNQHAVTCCTCGIVFSMPDWFDTKLRRSHETFYCPSGHRQIYSEKSDVELAREAAAVHQAEAERQRLAAIDARCEAQNQRLKAERLGTKLKRVRHGVCPECKRSFENVRRHMAAKHPGCVARAK